MWDNCVWDALFAPPEMVGTSPIAIVKPPPTAAVCLLWAEPDVMSESLRAAELPAHDLLDTLFGDMAAICRASFVARERGKGGARILYLELGSPWEAAAFRAVVHNTLVSELSCAPLAVETVDVLLASDELECIDEALAPTMTPVGMVPDYALAATIEVGPHVTTGLAEPFRATRTEVIAWAHALRGDPATAPVHESGIHELVEAETEPDAASAAHAPLLRLPQELLVAILVHTNARTVIALAGTCRTGRRVAADPYLWRQLFVSTLIPQSMRARFRSLAVVYNASVATRWRALYVASYTWMHALSFSPVSFVRTLPRCIPPVFRAPGFPSRSPYEVVPLRGSDLMLTISREFEVALWDARSGGSQGALSVLKAASRGGTGIYARVSVHPGVNAIALLSHDGRFSLVDLEAGKVVVDASMMVSASQVVAYDVAGGDVAVVLQRGVIKVFAVGPADVALAAESYATHRYATRVALSGSHVVTAARDDPALRVERRLRGHTKAVTALARSDDVPGTVASASADGTLRVWDVASGQCRHKAVLGHTVDHIAYDAVRAVVGSSRSCTISLVILPLGYVSCKLRYPMPSTYRPITSISYSDRWIAVAADQLHLWAVDVVGADEEELL